MPTLQEEDDKLFNPDRAVLFGDPNSQQSNQEQSFNPSNAILFEEPKIEEPDDGGFIDETVRLWDRFTYNLGAGFDEFGSSQDMRTTLKTLDTIKRVKSLLKEEGLSQKFRQQKERDLVDLGNLLNNSTESLAENIKQIEAAPMSDYAIKVMQSDGFEEGWKAFKEHPLDFIAEVGSRSAVHSVPSLVAGAVGSLAGPWGAGIASGAASSDIEYNSGIMQAFQETGIDLTDANAIQEAVKDKDFMDGIKKKAAIKAAIVGAFDGASFGLASKTMAPQIVKSIVAKQAINLPSQMIAQSALGGLGEGLGQLASTGEVKAGEVIGEMAGEFITAPVDVLVAAKSAAFDSKGRTLGKEMLKQIDSAEYTVPAREVALEVLRPPPAAPRTTQQLIADLETSMAAIDSAATPEEAIDIANNIIDQELDRVTAFEKEKKDPEVIADTTSFDETVVIDKSAPQFNPQNAVEITEDISQLSGERIRTEMNSLIDNAAKNITPATKEEIPQLIPDQSHYTEKQFARLNALVDEESKRSSDDSIAERLTQDELTDLDTLQTPIDKTTIDIDTSIPQVKTSAKLKPEEKPVKEELLFPSLPAFKETHKLKNGSPVMKQGDFFVDEFGTQYGIGRVDLKTEKKVIAKPKSEPKPTKKTETDTSSLVTGKQLPPQTEEDASIGKLKYSIGLESKSSVNYGKSTKEEYLQDIAADIFHGKHGSEYGKGRDLVTANEYKLAEKAYKAHLADGGEPTPFTSKSKTPIAKPEVTKPAKKIEDFGEVLEGAKKHTYTFDNALNEKGVDDTLPLSKTFPKPDYEKMATDKIDPVALARIAKLRGDIKSKPRQGWKLKAWKESVQQALTLSEKILKGEKPSVATSLTKMEDKIFSLAKDVDPSQIERLSDFSIRSAQYTMYNGVEGKFDKFIVRDRKDKGGMRGLGRDQDFDTEKQALDYIKAQVGKKLTGKKGTKFDVWRERGKEGVYLGKKIGTHKYIDLGHFSTSGLARTFLAENQEKLETELAKRKKFGEHRRAVNVDRVGEDYRKGKAVKPELFNDTFGFRGVQFGNWVEDGKRQKDLDEAFDGLIDLANIINVPPEALSLNGELGLAFGARGKGGTDPAAAHYEPAGVVINLTKKSGSGSLGHEWFHALDNFFGKKDDGDFSTEFTRPKRKGIAVDGYQKFVETTDSDFTVRKEVYDAFVGIRKAIQNETKLAERSKIRDKSRGKDYWSTVLEMAARSFERYLIGKLDDNNQSSDFLANIMSEEDHNVINEKSIEMFGDLGMGQTETDPYVYPLNSEMEAVNKAYDNLFTVLKTKKTDKGTTFFSQSKLATNKTTTTKGDVEAAISDQVMALDESLGIIINVIPASEISQYTNANIPKGKKVKGFVSKGTNTMYLVHDHISDGKDASVVLAHELIGHIGTNAIIGKANWGKTVTLYKDLNNTGDARFDSIQSELMRRYGKINELRQVKEFIAIAAERNEKSGVVGKFLSKVKAYFNIGLRALGFNTVSMSDIDEILMRSQQFVEGKGPVKGVPLSEITLSREVGGKGGKMQIAEVRADIVLRRTQKKRDTALGLLRCING